MAEWSSAGTVAGSDIGWRTFQGCKDTEKTCAYALHDNLLTIVGQFLATFRILCALAVTLALVLLLDVSVLPCFEVIRIDNLQKSEI